MQIGTSELSQFLKDQGPQNSDIKIDDTVVVGGNVPRLCEKYLLKLAGCVGFWSFHERVYSRG